MSLFASKKYIAQSNKAVAFTLTDGGLSKQRFEHEVPSGMLRPELNFTVSSVSKKL